LHAETLLEGKRWQFPIEYIFSDDGVKIKGISFESTFAWLHIVKVKEDNDFLIIIYHQSGGLFYKKRCSYTATN